MRAALQVAMSFLQAVRRGMAPQPTQRSFTFDRWNRGFAEHGDGSQADQHLSSAGAWFFDQFERARNAWNSLTRLEVPPRKLTRWTTGAVNFLVASADPEAEGGVEMVAVPPPLRTHEVGETVAVATPVLAEKVQGLIVGARIALANASNGKEPEGNSNLPGTKGPVGNAMRARVWLGMHYTIL